MSIQELSLKFKGYLSNTDILLGILIVFVSLSSFFLGRLSVTEKTQEIQQKAELLDQKDVSIIRDMGAEEVSGKSIESLQPQNSQGGYVASKGGTKYHLPWCSGAKRIKEENKVWFKTKEEAEKAGYLPASNCKGI